MTVLVTGGQGQLGTGLRAIGSIMGHAIVAPGRDALDICDAASIERAITDDVVAVINCAAFTDVDGAELDAKTAFALNADAPGRLADACNRKSIRLVHISTDYVFDGRSPAPRGEDDPIAPTSVYGRSKAAGEARIMAAGGPHAIFRTAWLFSPWRKNFVATMIRLAKERDEIRVVADQQGSPTSAIDLADAIAKALPVLLAREGKVPRIFHAVNAGSASWAELAEAIMIRLEHDQLPAAHIVGIATQDYPVRTARPAYSILSNARLHDELGIAMRPWTEALDDVMDRILSGNPS